ncbi:hypothetical protein IQ268_00180 [Oculatella sp. LEGE 06141]|uniref:hypothetical protein n=1 Tax=Oculatella sp. LEGE 06141 TaxID=1828648 RepID=UPI0018804B5A|nr:hypothetical protein [Oculatella sp. LEGE 06141]MBE9176992.1 hypothetical protein [Oculatella sp. LEGE 06141]
MLASLKRLWRLGYITGVKNRGKKWEEIGKNRRLRGIEAIAQGLHLSDLQMFDLRQNHPVRLSAVRERK